MDLVKGIESILKQEFRCDNTKANLVANRILDVVDLTEQTKEVLSMKAEYKYDMTTKNGVTKVYQIGDVVASKKGNEVRIISQAGNNPVNMKEIELAIDNVE